MANPNPKAGPGRPKGIPNKITAEHRAWIDGLLSEQRETFKTNLALLDPKDHCRIYSDLMEFAIPKLARTELISEDQNKMVVEIRRVNVDQSKPTS